jgi:hypothetical protein
MVGGVLSALAGVFTAPRAGESRRAALTRLESWLRRRGGVDAFAGTPCSVEDSGPDPGDDEAPTREGT